MGAALERPLKFCATGVCASQSPFGNIFNVRVRVSNVALNVEVSASDFESITIGEVRKAVAEQLGVGQTLADEFIARKLIEVVGSPESTDSVTLGHLGVEEGAEIEFVESAHSGSRMA